MTYKEFQQLGTRPKNCRVKWGNKTMRIVSVNHISKIIYLTPIDRRVYRPYPAEYTTVELIHQ